MYPRLRNLIEVSGGWDPEYYHLLLFYFIFGLHCETDVDQ